MSSCAVANVVWYLEQQNLKTTFVQFAKDDLAKIRLTLSQYLEVAKAVSAYQAASSDVNRQEFHTFVYPFLQSRPEIYAVAWAPLISAPQRTVYETLVRNETLPGVDLAHFLITEYQEGAIVPARMRPAYFPIHYREPINGESVPLGFDLGSETTYLQALNAAREQAQAIAIERSSFVGSQQQALFVVQIFYPVYQREGFSNEHTASRVPLQGFVSLLLCVDAVIANTLSKATSHDIHLTLYDQSTGLESLILYEYPSRAEAPTTLLNFDLEQHRRALTLVDTIEIGGRRWQLVLQPTLRYLAAHRRWSHWFVLLGGLLFTGLAVTYLRLLLDQHHQTETLVGERTQQLSLTNDQLQKTLQELSFQKMVLECTSEAAQDGILIVSLTRKWLFVNQRFIDMWHIPRPIIEHWASEEGTAWVVSQVATPGNSQTNIEYLYAHPDVKDYAEVFLKNGAVFERFSAPVKHVDGTIYARVWYFRDISQRKAMEKALSQSEARNRALVNAIPDLLFRVDKAGRILDYQGVTTYRPRHAAAELLGQELAALFPGEAAQCLKQLIASVLVSGEVSVVESEMPIFGGEPRAWEQRIVMINEEEVLLIIRDITPRKRAETALYASQKQVQEHQRREKELVEAELERVRHQLVIGTRFATLGQVAATIAHELRNPLGAVRNAVYYIRRYLAPSQQELAELMQMIDREVTTADRIITDLLEMTRPKEPAIQSLDLGEVTREVWRQAKQEDAIQFRCALAVEPFWVTADPTQLRQILANLITNAVQAMPEGGELWVTAEHQGPTDLIAVQDSGPGVPSALCERIFEPLFTTKAKGTGLGLAICRQIIEKHGGTIELENSTQGAKFTILLPHQLPIQPMDILK